MPVKEAQINSDPATIFVLCPNLVITKAPIGAESEITQLCTSKIVLKE
jgi:hypothetical protein